MNRLLAIQEPVRSPDALVLKPMRPIEKLVAAALYLLRHRVVGVRARLLLEYLAQQAQAETPMIDNATRAEMRAMVARLWAELPTLLRTRARREIGR